MRRPTAAPVGEGARATTVTTAVAAAAMAATRRYLGPVVLDVLKRGPCATTKVANLLVAARAAFADARGYSSWEPVGDSLGESRMTVAVVVVALGAPMTFFFLARIFIALSLLVIGIYLCWHIRA